MKAKLERLPFFLVTIPVFFFLHNNNYYFGLLEWSLLEKEMLLYLLVPFILLILFRYLLGSWNKAGVFMGLLLILFYFFQPIQDFLKRLPYISIVAKYKVLLPILFISLLVLVLWLRKVEACFHNFYQYLNILFFFLIISEAAISLYNAETGKIKAHDLADESKKLAQGFKICDTCMRPDIYFFIFDEYTSEKILATEFNYSNAKLTDNLKAKGFYVADDSRSNYNFTHMSIASELNMRYLPSVHNGDGYYARDLLKANYTVTENEFCKILKKQGYTLNNYSIFDIETAPTHSPRPFREQYFRFVLDQTLLRKIIKDIGWNFTATRATTQPSVEKRQEIREDIDRIAESKEGVIRSVRRAHKDPAFTYAHFLMPHPPFYFDSTGKRLPELYSLYHTGRTDYLQSLAYANKFVIVPLIDSIFKFSLRPFIIILQGDHGYRNYTIGKEDLEFYNLNAMYFPSRDYKECNPSMTSVNTFRIVLNRFFSAGLPLLKDSSFYLKRNPE